MSVPDDEYFRNESCGINYETMFLLYEERDLNYIQSKGFFF